MRAMRFAIAAVMLAVTAGQANAGFTITFDSLESAGTGLISVGDPYIESGFKLTDNGSFYAAQQSNYQYAGSAGLHERVSGGSITLSAVSGSPFDLTSIDLSILASYGTSPAVTFTGTLSGGGTVAQSFTPVVFGFATFTFNSSFVNLTSVTWYQGSSEGSAHQFDNIRINGGVEAVTPEPTSLALAGFAGIGMAVGAWRRRRQQAA
jgi:hypothetical protein